MEIVATPGGLQVSDGEPALARPFSGLSEAATNGMRDVSVALERSPVPMRLIRMARVQGAAGLAVAVVTAVMLAACEVGVAGALAEGLGTALAVGLLALFVARG